MIDKQKLKEIEECYPRQIFIEDITQEDIKGNLKWFILKFFEWNREKRSMSINNIGRRYRQCDSWRSRSIGEIFNICRNYYPNLDINTFLKTFYQLALDGQMGCSWCYIVRKKVWNVPQYGRRVINDTDRKDEFGLYYQDYIEHINELNNQKHEITTI